MPINKRNQRSTSRVRRDVYQEVTDKIVAALESGVPPWVKPWTSRGGGVLPVNVSSQKAYRGINVLILGFGQ